jgi:hypothetical protein
MFKWLARKAEDSRVYMCTKEVKGELERATSLKRATILALAQLFRQGPFAEPELRELFDRPLDHSREKLLKLYTGLETIRNRNKVQCDRMRANHPHIVGIALPPFMVEQAKATNRGLEVWMCTLGAGLSPHLRNDVHTMALPRRLAQLH